ncbi:MAG: SUMF1/EgtB/PvdO family nonheme iron enzyme, partial [Myxococcales bacterium]|nr:SUMF1/EgtB/PvdO family nonheme iron enzyme [Myxococcales bacterium]
DWERCYAWTGEGFEQGAPLPDAFARDDAPAVCVTWRQAAAYCGWLGKRLPTELEWEVAARGGDRRIYPWGAEEPTCEHANFAECGRTPTAVDARPPRLDEAAPKNMAGNVAEWIHDWYGKSYSRSWPRDPRGPRYGRLRGVRGGSFYDPPEVLRTSYRYALTPGFGYAFVGLRCVADM